MDLPASSELLLANMMWFWVNDLSTLSSTQIADLWAKEMIVSPPPFFKVIRFCSGLLDSNRKPKQQVFQIFKKSLKSKFSSEISKF